MMENIIHQWPTTTRKWEANKDQQIREFLEHQAKSFLQTYGIESGLLEQRKNKLAIVECCHILYMFVFLKVYTGQKKF